MPLDLDRLGQRVVGVLIEKEMSVPESYPLTLNALVAGCNQKSNRDPQMTVEPYEVEGALRALMDHGWVQELDKEGGRTMRYAHLASSQLGVEAADLAILAELLCRGPQTPTELKTRCARMHPLGSPAEVEGRLAALAARPVPYVARLPRRPREHAARWTHRLGPVAEEGDAPVTGAAAPTPTPVAAPSPQPAAAPALETRIRELEERLLELADRLDGLEDRLGRIDEVMGR